MHSTIQRFGSTSNPSPSRWVISTGSSPVYGHIVIKAPTVSRVRAQTLHRWDVGKNQICQHTTLYGVSSIGGMHVYARDKTERIHGYLPAATFDFLAAVEPSAFTFVVGFDTLGVDEEVGRGGIAPFFDGPFC